MEYKDTSEGLGMIWFVGKNASGVINWGSAKAERNRILSRSIKSLGDFS